MRIQPTLAKRRGLIHSNLRIARRRWGTGLSRTAQAALRVYSEQLGMSIERGDLVLLEGNWYATHAGLLRLASHRRCSGIDVVALPEFSDPSRSRWVVKATVYKSPKCKGFVGYGDADPSNVSALVHGAEMRVAETRAVNRACVRPMALASAQSRSWVRSLDRYHLLPG